MTSHSHNMIAKVAVGFNSRTESCCGEGTIFQWPAKLAFVLSHSSRSMPRALSSVRAGWNHSRRQTTNGLRERGEERRPAIHVDKSSLQVLPPSRRVHNIEVFHIIQHSQPIKQVSNNIVVFLRYLNALPHTLHVYFTVHAICIIIRNRKTWQELASLLLRGDVRYKHWKILQPFIAQWLTYVPPATTLRNPIT